MINRNLAEQLNDFDSQKLARSSELGVHYNFEKSVPILENYFVYLKEIIDLDSPLLTEAENKLVESEIQKLLNLRQKIINFNPKERDNATTYQNLVTQINQSWQEASGKLRPIYNFLKVKSTSIEKTVKKAEDTLEKIKETYTNIEQKRKEVENLPTDTENRFNASFKGLQERLTKDEGVLRQEIENLKNQTKNTINELEEQTKQKIDQAETRIANLSKVADQKIGEVLQQAKKFSAKSALATYAEIFLREANNINKPAIRKWERNLLILVLVEIATALSLFFLFLPEVFEISESYGEKNNVGIGLIISILFVKIFILSVIAIGISYAVKNLNAQNHLYAINKFKANSLASFQAFLDATDNERVIDSIIQQVSIAVYSQNISGYLSKDDAVAKGLDENTGNFITKLMGH